MSALFTTAYLPPVSYLKECSKHETIVWEKHEHFIKQTYRNRCYIYGPNGKQSLIIPLIHEKLFTIPIHEVKISYQSPWNRIHWKSMCAAYRNSAYFEYFEEDFRQIYLDPGENLFDFNLRLFNAILRFYKIKSGFEFTDSYEKVTALKDFRNSFSHKVIKEIKQYHQVFGDRHGFIADLSCIDCLFNEGGFPE